MKSILAVCLLAMVLLFVAGPVLAAVSQPGAATGALDRSGKVCENPQIVTRTYSNTFFGGPKVGWMTVPVEDKILVCR